MSVYLYAAVGLAVLAVIAYPVLTYLIDKPEGGHHRPPWWRRWREERARERAQDALNMRLIHDISEGIKREATGTLTSSGMPRAGWPLQPLPPGVEERADHFHRQDMPPLPVDEAAERAMWGEHYGQPGEPGWEGTREDYAAAMAPPEPEVAESPCPECGCLPSQPWGCGCNNDRADVANAEIDGYWRGYGDGARAEAEDPAEVATDEQVADDLVGLAETPGSGDGVLGASSPRSSPLTRAEPEPAPLTDYRETTGSWEALRDDVLAGGE